MIRIEQRNSAAELPPDWDVRARSYFQQREFLSYAEQWNPCRQRYYVLADDTAVLAGAIVYTLTLDLLTFLRIPSPMQMHVIGVPIGTATAGYFGDSASRHALFTHIRNNEHGLLLTLNADTDDDLPAGTRCRMVPTIVMDTPFASWAEYEASLRSLYRRRLRQISEHAARLSRVVSDCSAFTVAHFGLYRQVHDRAAAKLETLTLDFFRHLPPRFQLASYYRNGVLISWTITVHDGSYFMYFFGGMDYAIRKETNAYFIGLTNIVRDCIEGGHRVLDLGQTADEPKMRFGGHQLAKDMYITHTNSVLRALLHCSRSMIGYRGRILSFDVFK